MEQSQVQVQGGQLFYNWVFGLLFAVIFIIVFVCVIGGVQSSLPERNFGNVNAKNTTIDNLTVTGEFNHETVSVKSNADGEDIDITKTTTYLKDYKGSKSLTLPDGTENGQQVEIVLGDFSSATALTINVNTVYGKTSSKFSKFTYDSDNTEGDTIRLKWFDPKDGANKGWIMNGARTSTKPAGKSAASQDVPVMAS